MDLLIANEAQKMSAVSATNGPVTEIVHIPILHSKVGDVENIAAQLGALMESEKGTEWAGAGPGWWGLWSDADGYVLDMVVGARPLVPVPAPVKLGFLARGHGR